MQCGATWQPSRLIRPVQQLTTSTKPLHVITDAGPAIMKSIGNPMGCEALAFDFVGTELARWIGLTTPDFALLPLKDISRDWCQVFEIEDGHAFLSRYLSAATYEGDAIFLDFLARPEDIARLVIFDTWVCNEDRYPPNQANSGTPVNLDNLMFSKNNEVGNKQQYDLMVFDHTHAFSSGGYDELEDPAQITAEGVYGLFPAFQLFLTQQAIDAATRRLRQIDANEVGGLLDAIPPEWGVTTKLKRLWCNLIVCRAHFVADTITDKIIYQREIWKGGGDVG